ncbi:MAG: type II toxin-antitoxin system RelE/ParE family toxin [Nitrospirae bacterium]|nr:MAG: type II toxin-antitoxin system RelE/ParE family toxin [Nitrospirota bacterium]
MKRLHVDIPPHVAEEIRHFPPDLKRSVKRALRLLSDNPQSGVPLVKELEGYWKYRVNRFRIVYSVDRKAKILRVVAIGHRRGIYEDVAKLLRKDEP